MKSRMPQGYGASRGDMMKQMQKMQQDMSDMQDILAERTYTAKAGGGMVEVTIKGDHTVVGVNLDPEVVDPEDTEMLGDLITAAFNEAIRQSAEDSEKEMGAITGGLAGFDPSSLGLGL